jgi:hypothetical protein
MFLDLAQEANNYFLSNVYNKPSCQSNSTKVNLVERNFKELIMSFTYKTQNNRISKIEFTGDPQVANIAFSDPGPTYGPTVIIFGVPSATASAIAVNFSFGGIVREITIVTQNAPTKVGGNSYFEAQYGGRVAIS